MKKRNFVPWRLMLVLVAVAATMPCVCNADDDFSHSKTYCLEHYVTASDNTSLPAGSTYYFAVTLTQVDPVTYRTTGLAPNFGGPGVAAMSEGFGLVSGSLMISTLTTAIAPIDTGMTPPGFISAGTYQCNMTFKHGKLVLPGAFWQFSTVAFPSGADSMTTLPTVSWTGYYKSVSDGPCP